MRLSFFKMSGAGNDFVLIQGSARLGSLPALARRLCDRRRGIGADGLLVMGRRGPRTLLRHFNADGSETFCGNGSRCAAWWMHQEGWPGKSLEFGLETSAGPLKARVTGREKAAISMPRPGEIQLGLKLKVLGKAMTAHAIDTGVPHAVVQVENLADFPVLEAGRTLRNHPDFAPEGANADFVKFRSGGADVRTYERGVEGETLACGTGAVAAAAVGFLLGKVRPPVRVKVRSGDELKVSFRPSGQTFDEVWLEGPARRVFSGEVNL